MATGGRRVVLASVIGVGLMLTPTVSHAATDVASASLATRAANTSTTETSTAMTSAVSSSVARVGQRVAVSGSVSSDEERPVVLQRLDGRTWTSVASARTNSAYRLMVPTATPGVSSYRVVAPPTAAAAGRTGATFTVAVGEGNPRSYGFLTNPPTRWDPCTEIGYRVNVAAVPAAGRAAALADARRAVEEVASASGLPLRYRGATSVVPGSALTDRPSTYPADTQLVIAYTTPNRTGFLKPRPQALGVGGVFYDLTPETVARRPYHRAVQGYVVLNTTQSLPSGFGPGRTSGKLGTWGQVLLHELGHAVGLDHPAIEDDTQIMHPLTTYKPARYGAGDLAGLRQLGAASGCFASSSTRRAGTAPAAILAGHAG